MKASQLRCWDNGGATFDRYTILPSASPLLGKLVEGIAASEAPFHPQGFGQYITAQPGKHLGKRVNFETLPGDVQRFAKQFFDIKEN